MIPGTDIWSCGNCGVGVLTGGVRVVLEEWDIA